jgi:uncharacterized protein (DUF1697 family)
MRQASVPTFVALLRGVNVGKAKRVPMASLRSLLTNLGYDRVTTLLNSGNAVFRGPGGPSSKVAQAIEKALADEFKFEVPVVVKSTGELRRIVGANSLVFAAEDHARLLAVFAQTSAAFACLASAADLVAPTEQFLLGKHAAYFHCPNGILQSKAGEALLGKAGKMITTRNWATVLKLQALAETIDA